MNGWKTWILGIFAGLVTLGVGGALGLGFSLASDVAVAQEAIIHNAGSMVAVVANIEDNEDDIEENEDKIDRVATEWEWFKDQYREDVERNNDSHRKIIEKLDKL